MMKIGIVGDRSYQNRTKVKTFIFKLKQKGNVEIVGCGSEWHKKNDVRYINNWIGDIVKKFSLEMELPYSEFPPSHHNHNMYCALEPYNYGKPFKPWNYKDRDKKMVEYCDKFVLFRSRTKDRKELNFMIKRIELMDKPYVLCG